MVLKRKKDGSPLGETAEMKMWREQFEKMGLEEHDEKLKQLGLDDEDIKEFNQDFSSKGANKKRLIDGVADEK